MCIFFDDNFCYFFCYQFGVWFCLFKVYCFQGCEMKIFFVVFVFNEEEVILIFYKMVCEFEELKLYEVEIVFINDGSKDVMELIINVLVVLDFLVVLLLFICNFGKELVLFVGLDYVIGDVIILIDVDL